MARLRVGIVGLGRHGSRYAHHAAVDVDGLQLVAVCRRDEARGRALAAELGCDYETEALHLVTRDDVDAVILVTVPRLLPQLVAAAAGAGKRLLIEKPVGRNIDDGLAMLRSVESEGVYCLAGHTLRLNAAVEALRRELPSLGRLDSFLFSQRFPPQLHLAWLDDFDEAGGGNILHTGVHCFDLLRWLSGEDVAGVFAQARTICTTTTEDSFVASLTMTWSSLLAQVSCSRSTQSRNGLIEVSGEHGQIVVDHVLGSGYRLDRNGRSDIAVDPPRMTVLEILRLFEREVRADAAPSIPLRDGLAAVAVADACYRSLESRALEAVTPLPIA